MKKILFQIAFLFFVFQSTKAQEVLRLEDAVQIALKNNYDIRLASTDLKIDEANVGVANAGMLPKVDATFTKNNSIQNSKQTQSNGVERELDNAKNNTTSYGVNLGWTVFDGLKMFARYDQLRSLQKQGETELKLTVMTKVSSVMSSYYDLVQQQHLLKALDTTIVISKQRLKTADNRFIIGKASKLEVLNAQVDLNADISNLLKQKEVFQNAKISFNELLARETDTDFTVVEMGKIDENLQLTELRELVKSQNPELQLALINKKVAESNLKQVKANRYPVVRLNAGYNFNESQSSLGFTSQSTARGLNYGVSASINVFNGFLQHRNEKIAKLQVENSTTLIEQQTKTIDTQLAMAYQTYKTNLELMKLEKENEAIAKRNLEITLDKFKIGTIPTIEFRNAQENYITAIARHTTAKFQAKISEVVLQEITGSIKF
ncbi:TolC family protein [Flavobacterium sp. SM15]|uniref:TolC family protein n=1 Tax=Flavobacterium sp. SM15 TaxID=2908005 RepID=UPI001EDBA359|nr:TolC family protein [Flavobacterium sp. SM15]MCG2610696.1 TolC family protein [Flavobacterium sp. SM15]